MLDPLLDIGPGFPFDESLCYPPAGAYTVGMIDQRHIHNLALTGFMGTGKSSVGDRKSVV